MTPTETERHQLQQALTDALHEGPAKTLMESLPPMDWHELATKTDLAANEERVDVRLEALRIELGAKIDMGLTDLNAKIDMGLTDLNAKIDTGLAGVRGEIADLRGEMKSGRATQTYVFLVGLAAIMTPIYLALFTGLGA